MGGPVIVFRGPESSKTSENSARSLDLRDGKSLSESVDPVTELMSLAMGAGYECGRILRSLQVVQDRRNSVA